MKNVTITLTEEAAHWARVRAAERNTSMSRMVGELLQEEMERERGYRAAQERFFAVEPRVLRRAGTSLPTRDELHDRASLR